MARLPLALAAALAVAACGASGPGLPACPALPDDCGGHATAAAPAETIMSQIDRELADLHGPLTSIRPEPRPEDR